MSARLELGLLGSFHMLLCGEPIRLSSQKAKVLMAYLVVEEGVPHERSRLASMLWPDASNKSARDSLRQEISLLRKSLDDRKSDAPFLESTRQTIQMNLTPEDSLDFHRFRESFRTAKALSQESPEEALHLLEQGAALYRGDFLSDLEFLEEEELLAAWAQQYRLSLRQEALDLFSFLTEAHMSRQAWDKAYEIGLHQIAMEPWRELAHQQVMRLLAAQGKRTDALAQYETCHDILIEELGVKPSGETKALHQRILADTFPLAASSQDPFPVFAKKLESTTTTKAISPPGNDTTHRLPKSFANLSSFVGRQQEMRELENWLQEDVRMVTLLAMGGMGKTRLAQELATKLQGAYEHGAAFIPLAAVSTLEPMISAIANALDLPFGEGSDTRQQLLSYLQHKQMLIVLDNMEQLTQTEIQSFLKDLLEQAPRVQLLVTSRERLRIHAERLYPLGNLEDKGTQEDAVGLFLQHAYRAFPHIGKEETDKIQALCSQVNSIPLAIELAAALTSIFSLDEILHQLEQSTDVLTTDLHEIPERHRSLRAVFEPSWNSLSSDEQSVLACCSVFRGGFTLAGAQHVADASSQHIAQLLSKSLIHQKSHRRYEIHELIRQYAEEKLSEDEENLARTRHAAYYTALLKEQIHQAFGEIDIYDVELPLPVRSSSALEQITSETENLDSAWQWNLHCASVDVVTQYAKDMWSLLRHRQRWAEALELLQGALQRFPYQGGEPLMQSLWMYQSGLARWNSGHLDTAWDHFRDALMLMGEDLPETRLRKVLALWKQIGRWLGSRIGLFRKQRSPAQARLKLKVCFQLLRLYALREASALDVARCFWIGLNTSCDESEDSAALAVFLSQKYLLQRKLRWAKRAASTKQETLRITERIQSPALDGYVHFFFAQGKASIDPWPEVQEDIERGLQVFSSASHRAQWILNSMVLFYIHLFQGQYQKAADVAAFQQRLEPLAPFYEVLRLFTIGLTQAYRGHHDAAREAFASGLILTKDMGSFPSWQASNLSCLAWVSLRQGQASIAFEYASKAHRISEKLGLATPYILYSLSQPLEVFVSLFVGDNRLSASYRQELEQLVEQSMVLARRFSRSNTIMRPCYYLQRGRLLQYQGSLHKAHTLWKTAIDWAKRLDMPFEEAHALFEWGKSLGAKHPQGRQALEQAQEIFERLGTTHDLALVKATLTQPS